MHRVVDNPQRSSTIVVSTLLIILLIITVGGSTSEIAGRQELLESVNKALHNTSSIALDDILISSSSGNRDSVIAAATRAFNTKVELGRLREGVELLVIQGAQYPEQTMFKLRSRLDAILQTNSTDQSHRQIWTESPYTAWTDKVRILLFGSPTSNTLLLVAISCCGVIGVLISGLKSKSNEMIGSIPIGLAAGYITYLSILGAKKVFLLNSGFTDAVGLNPYSGAFLGLVAGLFTQKVYKLLTAVVENVLQSIESLSGKE